MEIKIEVSELTMDSVIGEVLGQDDETGDTYPVGSVTLRELVAEKIVDRLVQDREVWPKLHELVTQVRKEIITAKVEPQVIAALENPIQRTNDYGDPKGDPITMRDLIISTTQSLLNKPAKGSDYRNPRTWFQDVINTRVDAVIRADITAMAQQMKEGVKQALNAQLAAALAKDVGKDLSRG